MRSTLVRHALITAGAGLLLFALTFALEPFRDYQLATAAAYLCAAAGLTVLTGLSGQISLGHSALMATGAYTVALLQNALHARGLSGAWMLPVSLAAGTVTALVAGAVIGMAAARLRGPYLAGATLALATAVPGVATTFDGVLHGDEGLHVEVDPAPGDLPPSLPYERWQAWLALTAALLVMLLLANVVRSRYGRLMRAVRDDEIAAQLAGIHVARTQVLAFVLSAGCAGFGGGVLAILSLSVSPGGFSLALSLGLLLAVVIGGLGSLAGAALGSIVLVAVPEALDTITGQLGLSQEMTRRLEGNLPFAVYGLILAVLMIAAPSGIQGLYRRLAVPLLTRIRRWGGKSLLSRKA
ncbi:branched-chain amino acid ABC transporter permease [Streptomyces sp. KR80]|uniref:branched-chain amino acid ABC transporter permease n=1 Tax=Streptomyces sp. KR80 TaxID=3457426 RepID=UPI003FD63256